MECRDFQVQAADFLGNQLPAENRGAIESHRETCRDCVAYLEDIRTLTATLRGTVGPNAPSDLWTRIDKRLGERPAVPASGFLRFAAAACAAILMCVILMLGRRGETPTGDATAKIKYENTPWVAAEGSTESGIDPLSEMLLTSAE